MKLKPETKVLNSLILLADDKRVTESMFKVSFVKGANPEIMVKEALDLIGGLDSYVTKGQRVFIKPNVCGGVPGKICSFTNPKVLESTIRLLRKKGVSVSVGEADSCMYTADVMLKETGIRKIAEKEGAEVVNLSKGDMVELEVPNGSIFKSISVNKTLANADAIISMPVMKTHACSVVTLGMKSMLGVLPERKKSRYHPKLEQAIIDINSALPPKLTIIDATTAMEGQGPFNGEPVNLDLVIAGNNVVSTDSFAATVMGIDPAAVDHLRLASQKGLGTINLDEIEVKGVALETVEVKSAAALKTVEFKSIALETVKRPFILAKPIKTERIISKLSTELGYMAIHSNYEGAVKSWKKTQTQGTTS